MKKMRITSPSTNEKNLFLSLILIFMLILTAYNSLPVRAPDGVIGSPYGQNEWRYESTGISVYYYHKDEDIDYIISGDKGGNLLSVTIIEETAEWANVKLRIEFNEYTLDSISFDYHELLFQVRKDNNDATLIEEGHPMEDTRIGFFPFFGFVDHDLFGNRYHYFLGGESEPVDYVHGSSINAFCFEEITDMSYPIYSLYRLRNNQETSKVVQMEWVGGIHNLSSSVTLSMMAKQYQGRLYPIYAYADFPANFFIKEPDDVAMISISAEYSAQQVNTIEFLQSLPDMDDPYNEGGFSRFVAFLIGASAVVAVASGYLAYKKKAGG